MYTSDNQYMTDAGITGTEILVVLSGMDEGLYNMFKEYDYSEEEKKKYKLWEELIKAVKANNIIQVNRLLEIGAGVDFQDNDRMTVLMWASIYGYINIVDKLLEVEGIGVNIQDNAGRTALMLASEYGKMAIVEKLLKVKGIEVDIQNDYGKTALMYASEYGYIKIVKLLKARANVDIQDDNGNTALMWASYYGKKDIVELLKSHVREKE